MKQLSEFLLQITNPLFHSSWTSTESERTLHSFMELPPFSWYTNIS